MAIHEIELNDGTKVNLKPDISIKKLRQFQREGLLPESLLDSFVNAESDPKKMEPYLINAAWVAYRNANPTSQMEQDDFEDQLPLDFELFGEILAEMVGGSAKADGKLAQGFKRSTKK